MIARYLAPIVFGVLSAPAFAHPGDHDNLAASDYVAHVVSSVAHLLPLAAALALIAVMFWYGRDRATVRLPKDH